MLKLRFAQNSFGTADRTQEEKIRIVLEGLRGEAADALHLALVAYLDIRSSVCMNGSG